MDPAGVGVLGASGRRRRVFAVGTGPARFAAARRRRRTARLVVSTMRIGTRCRVFPTKRITTGQKGSWVPPPREKCQLICCRIRAGMLEKDVLPRLPRIGSPQRPLAASRSCRRLHQCPRTATTRRVRMEEQLIPGSRAPYNHDVTINAGQDPHRAHDVPQQHRGRGRVGGQLRAHQAHPRRRRAPASRSASTWPWCSTSAARCTRKTAPASAASSASRTPPSPPSTSSSPTTPSRIVAFAHNAQVVLPPTSVAEKDKIEDVIRKIDMFDVDPGGTAMDEGIAPGPGRGREATAGAGKLSQVVVLTDGETSGETDVPAAGRAGRPEEDPLHRHGRRHRVEPEPHQGPGQARRGRVVLHRRQRRRGGRARLRAGVRGAGRHRLPQRRDAPAADEGHQDQARPPGRAGDQGTGRPPSRRSGTWSPRWARWNATSRRATSST